MKRLLWKPRERLSGCGFAGVVAWSPTEMKNAKPGRWEKRGREPDLTQIDQGRTKLHDAPDQKLAGTTESTRPGYFTLETGGDGLSLPRLGESEAMDPVDPQQPSSTGHRGWEGKKGPSERDLPDGTRVNLRGVGTEEKVARLRPFVDSEDLGEDRIQSVDKSKLVK